MDIQQGQRVLVNLAPFIGSQQRSRQSIPCDVLATTETQVEVGTVEPCRRLSLWVSSRWIDSRLEPSERQAAAV
jgi:hypothetical protein